MSPEELIKEQQKTIENLQKLLSDLGAGQMKDTLKDFKNSTDPAIQNMNKVADQLHQTAKGLTPLVKILSRLTPADAKRLLKD